MMVMKTDKTLVHCTWR